MPKELDKPVLPTAKSLENDRSKLFGIALGLAFTGSYNPAVPAIVSSELSRIRYDAALVASDPDSPHFGIAADNLGVIAMLVEAEIPIPAYVAETA